MRISLRKLAEALDTTPSGPWQRPVRLGHEAAVFIGVLALISCHPAEHRRVLGRDHRRGVLDAGRDLRGRIRPAARGGPVGALGASRRALARALALGPDVCRSRRPGQRPADSGAGVRRTVGRHPALRRAVAGEAGALCAGPRSPGAGLAQCAQDHSRASARLRHGPGAGGDAGLCRGGRGPAGYVRHHPARLVVGGLDAHHGRLRRRGAGDDAGPAAGGRRHAVRHRRLRAVDGHSGHGLQL